ncbi:unnamed protein product [Symbiodinium sp. CCMP2592]|nr:unnamed protein product [Symbiodinium sp. CCMP2592]
MAMRQESLQEPMFIPTSTELLVKPLRPKPDLMPLNSWFETLQATADAKYEESAQPLPAKGAKNSYKKNPRMVREGRRGSTGSVDKSGEGNRIRELLPSDLTALDEYIHRCRLGPFRPGVARGLVEQTQTAPTQAERARASKELQKLRSKSRSELGKLRRIQENRIAQLGTPEQQHPPEKDDKEQADVFQVTLECPRSQVPGHYGHYLPGKAYDRPKALKPLVRKLVNVLRVLSLGRHHRRSFHSSSARFAGRRLSDPYSEGEQAFLAKVLSFVPLMARSGKLMLPFLTEAGNKSGDLAATTIHQVKILTARAVWKDLVEPLKEEIEKSKTRHTSLQEVFNETRSEYLREVAALRDEVRIRGDPEKAMGLGQMKDVMFFFEPMKTLQPHELQYCLEVVKEKLKMIFEENAAVTQTVNFGQVDRLKELLVNAEVAKHREILNRKTAEIMELERERRHLQRELAIVSKGYRDAQVSVEAANYVSESNVATMSQETEKLRAEIGSLKETRFRRESMLKKTTDELRAAQLERDDAMQEMKSYQQKLGEAEAQLQGVSQEMEAVRREVRLLENQEALLAEQLERQRAHGEILVQENIALRKTVGRWQEKRRRSLLEKRSKERREEALERAKKRSKERRSARKSGVLERAERSKERSARKSDEEKRSKERGDRKHRPDPLRRVMLEEVPLHCIRCKAGRALFPGIHQSNGREEMDRATGSGSDNPLENHEFLEELLEVGHRALVAVVAMAFGAVSGHPKGSAGRHRSMCAGILIAWLFAVELWAPSHYGLQSYPRSIWLPDEIIQKLEAIKAEAVERIIWGLGSWSPSASGSGASGASGASDASQTAPQLPPTTLREWTTQTARYNLYKAAPEVAGLLAELAVDDMAWRAMSALAQSNHQMAMEFFSYCLNGRIPVAIAILLLGPEDNYGMRNASAAVMYHCQQRFKELKKGYDFVGVVVVPTVPLAVALVTLVVALVILMLVVLMVVAVACAISASVNKYSRCRFVVLAHAILQNYVSQY